VLATTRVAMILPRTDRKRFDMQPGSFPVVPGKSVFPQNLPIAALLFNEDNS
jgi:hypothetical protein